jgi:hypothetical protein
LEIEEFVTIRFDIPTVSLEPLPMQDLVGFDYNCTPVIFRSLDNCNIIGALTKRHQFGDNRNHDIEIAAHSDG